MTDYIDQFLEWVGDTDCPIEYFKFAAISLIAACLSNRVWINRQLGSQTLKVHPNLYTLFIGPSGNGKSLAMSRALNLLRRTQFETIINLYAGKMTAPAMYEMMWVAPRSPHPEKPFIYVCNDELANDIGSGEYADQFVKSLTRMYLGEPFSDATVTRGVFHIKHSYCVNWFACTMREWLKKAIKIDAVLGGFFARTIVIECGYTGRVVVPKEAPPGWQELDAHMLQETQRLLGMSGEFHRTPEATKLELEWVASRPRLLEGDPMAPTQRREYDHVMKFEQIFSAAEGHMAVTKEIVERAIKLAQETSRNIPELANYIALPERYHSYRELEGELRKRGIMTKVELVEMAHRKGLMADETGRLVGTWIESGLCIYDQHKGVYTWK